MKFLLICLAVYTAMSIVCFAFYAKDKHAAINNQRRISEQRLWLLGLCCGWPGGLLAQHWLRHKSAKVSFRIVFWLTVVANLAALAILLWQFKA
jgi:uncharacterized membrane protein YsdA (DUF1294 family)